MNVTVAFHESEVPFFHEIFVSPVEAHIAAFNNYVNILSAIGIRKGLSSGAIV